jgi:hypothetical protein
LKIDSSRHPGPACAPFRFLTKAKSSKSLQPDPNAA